MLDSNHLLSLNKVAAMALWVRNGLLAQGGIVAIFIYLSIRHLSKVTPLVGLMFLLISSFAWSICFADDRLDLRYGREKATKITMTIIFIAVTILLAAFCVIGINL